jgi:hypothetical protein
MRRQKEVSGSSDRVLQSSLEEALLRLVRILANQAAREAVALTPAPITSPADE